MGAATATGSARPARTRRPTVLLVLAVAAVVLLALYWFTRPQQVARIVLDRIGHALDLEISASGVSEYRLGDTPRMVVRDLVARQPGADAPLLHVERLSLALPWSTIRARGAELVVERLEADGPVVDLAALQRWLASRPPGPGPRIPTVTDGVRLEGGSLIGDGWSMEAVDLDLPALHPQRAVRARLRGQFRGGDIRIPFDLNLALPRPAAGAGLGIFGKVAIHTPDWRMPMRVRISGRPSGGDAGIGIDGFRAGAVATLEAGTGTEPLSFAFGLAGPLRWRDGRLGLDPLGAVVRGREMVPTLDARGALGWRQRLDLHLGGRLAGWPDGWPALPAPINESRAPLPFVLDYAGPPDLSGRTAMQLRREATRFDARFRLPQILEWLEQLDGGNPLPPLDGRLATPALELAGATLEGIELEIEQSGPSDE